jgi:hypothetical protein
MFRPLVLGRLQGAREFVQLYVKLLGRNVAYMIIATFVINSNYNHTRNISAKSVDIQAAQTHKLPGNGQEMRPKHVGAIIN